MYFKKFQIKIIMFILDCCIIITVIKIILDKTQMQYTKCIWNRPIYFAVLHDLALKCHIHGEKCYLKVMECSIVAC